VPPGIVDSVQASKTLQANMDGDGIDVSINLVTKTASAAPTYQFTGMGGYRPIEELCMHLVWRWLTGLTSDQASSRGTSATQGLTCLA
jgi:hypothetical protein